MKIMLAFDVTAPNEKVLQIACQYGLAFNASVCIVSCLTVSDATRKYWEKNAESILSDAEKVIKAKGLACETYALFSAENPGECLMDFASKNQIDQIVIGIRTKSKLQKMLIGSNAQHMILNAPCPVVCVPAFHQP